MIHYHIHRVELRTKTVMSIKKQISYMAASFGCSCKIDGTTPGSDYDCNWQQGFGIVNYENGNGSFHINPIVISDGKCIFNGILYQGNEKDYMEGLLKDTNYKF